MTIPGKDTLDELLQFYDIENSVNYNKTSIIF